MYRVVERFPLRTLLGDERAKAGGIKAFRYCYFRLFGVRGRGTFGW